MKKKKINRNDNLIQKLNLLRLIKLIHGKSDQEGRHMSPTSEI